MRWVVKVGSAVISKKNGGLDRNAVSRIAKQCSHLYKEGHEVLLVSSGAMAAGMGRLQLKERPNDLRLKQSTAAVGQLALMEAYEEAFSKSHIIPAQILLTRQDFFDRKRYLNIRNTVMNLLSLKTIPIINENDTVSVEEIQFGDNDTLAAIVATKVEADRLVLLSNVPGLYEFGGQTKVIPHVTHITKEMEKAAPKQGGSKYSIGGIASKIQAAKLVTSAGIECWIASGHVSDVLKRIEFGEKDAGTRFEPKQSKIGSRHVWIAFGRATKGKIFVDEGAQNALIAKQKSLLPKGVKSIRGQFSEGDTVEIKTSKGVEIGRGLVNFNSMDLKKIVGHHTSDIQTILGRPAAAEVVHRDNLVLL